MKKKIITWGTLVFALFAIDRITKLLAQSRLDGKSVRIGNLFRLALVENSGIAFGMMKENKWITIIGTICILLFLIGWLLFAAHHVPVLAQTGFWMTVAGGLGNLYDRISGTGNVIDFIEPLFINFAVFNVADIFVTVGAVMAAAGLLFIKGSKEDDRRVTERKR